MIADSVKLGKDVKIFQPDQVNMYGCTIGDGSRIGPFVEIQRGADIGRNCKISSHSFICEGVTIEDGVFIGHGVMFINDRYPRAVNADGSLQTDADWELLETRIGQRASIGSNATILAGITVGLCRIGGRVTVGAVMRRVDVDAAREDEPVQNVERLFDGVVARRYDESTPACLLDRLDIVERHECRRQLPRPPARRLGVRRDAGQRPRHGVTLSAAQQSAHPVPAR